MNHFNLITSIILFGLSILCFWLPFKVGNKIIGTITGAILSLIIVWTILAELEFLVVFIWPFILVFQIIFLTYWTFRIFNKPKTGKYISSFLTLGFILLCLSPWISDWTFSKNDARKLLAEHNINLKDDFEILKNESGGFMDYYHIFEIELSDRDYNRIKTEIIKDKNYLGNLDYDWYNQRPELRNLDTLNYENKYDYIRDYSEHGKMEDGTFHFVFELSKSKNKLKYIGSNE